MRSNIHKKAAHSLLGMCGLGENGISDDDLSSHVLTKFLIQLHELFRVVDKNIRLKLVE